MWFFTIIGFAAILWLLWCITQNTSESLEKQTALQKELIRLNDLLEQRQSAVPASKNAEGLMYSSRVNINTAKANELSTLPGIGKALAKKIVDARPYTKAEDLIKVAGINQEMLEKLLPLIEL